MESKASTQPQNDGEQNTTDMLVIETSGVTCAAGIFRDGKPVAEMAAAIRNIHSQVLASFVKDLLRTARVGPESLKGIVLSAGPGSFTGLRIGYSVAKGVAHALGIALVTVPTLDIWAYQSGAQLLPVLSVSDARRGEIFAALYRWHAGSCERQGEYRLLRPEQLGELLAEPALLAGQDAIHLSVLLKAHLPADTRLLLPQPPSPQLWALAELGLRKYRLGEVADIYTCEPLYIRTFKGVS